MTLAAIVLSSCAIDAPVPSVDDGSEVCVIFKPALDASIQTRAIGDGGKIDQLKVGVYEQNGSHSHIETIEWERALSEGISLTLIEGRSYDLVFWAQDSDNSAYELTENGTVTVDYNDYLDGGFAKMEELDAFCATSSVTVTNQKIEDKGTITLSRPLAQFNFADNTTQPVQGNHKAFVTFSSVPVSYDPTTGNVEMSQNPVVFSFADFTSDKLVVDGVEYYYISNNYLLSSKEELLTFNAALDLQNMDGTSVCQIELTDVQIEENKKTNVLGSIVQQPAQWSVWDGTIPAQNTISTDAQNRYVIDEAADLAWLGVNGSELEKGRTFIISRDIDMAELDGLSSINLPQGSTFDGDGHTIKNVNLDGALFGNATNLTLRNLNLEEILITDASSHVGVLVNTLKGSSSFSRITISNSSVTTTNGAAGGMVGYIARASEKDRTETLEVTFSACCLNKVNVAGSESEGKFVGLLSGYDNNESLTFDSDCTADDLVVDYASVYTKANNSEWAGQVDARYDGWLGHETYRRGKVTFAGVRMAPRWDGKTATSKADLLLYNGESNKYEVQSPFDLAGVRNATPSPAALYLMENVDMFGQGEDGKFDVPSNWTKSANQSDDDNYFMSFSSITYLDGGNYGIYNLNINTQKVSSSLYYGGFIQSTSGTTTHQNIKFYNSCVVVPLVVYKNEDKGSAGMLVSNIAGDSYKMDNVHTYGCKIFALQKVGGLAARVAATKSEIKNCSVNNGYIENYECKEHLETFSGGNSLASVSTTFYSFGEVGGMFGFVENNTNITDCNVNSTSIYAYGQDDKSASKSGLAFILLNYYTVPGRHVGTFIGDIRTTDDEKDNINISNCNVDTSSKCLNRQDKHNNKCEIIGRAYFLYLKDSEGVVKYNGTKLKLQNCTNNQNRNQ